MALSTNIASDDRNAERDDAHGERGVEIGDDDLDEDERRDEEVDVQLDQRADIEPAAAIEQPSDAEHDEDRQKNLDENGPKQHASL